MPRTISAPALCDIGARLLAAGGVSLSNAGFVAETLVAANLRGIDSHGIHLLCYYLKHLAAGTLDPVREGVAVSESGGCLSYDGQNGLGQIAARHCVNHSVRLAREHGISIVTARETNHFGACFWWARSIARNGMIGLVFCNSSNLVAPWQGRKPRFGTNPICMAVPAAHDEPDEPWLLDMATTTVAANKIFKAHINHQLEIPAGWAMDADGVPTTSTDAAYRGGLLSPLGGYKGYGLAMMVEILAAVLGGGVFGPELGGIRFTDRPIRVSHCYIAIDVARFMPAGEFTARVASYCRMMRETPPASGYNEVLVAGDPERRIEAERLASGIPIPDGNWQDLIDAAAHLGVEIMPVS